MNSTDLLHRLIYLDRAFVSNAYEVILNKQPVTQVVKTEGGNAGVQIPMFSAGVSATESKTFTASTFGMLVELWDELNKLPDIGNATLPDHAPSITCWISGEFTVSEIKVRSRTKAHSQEPKKKLLGISQHDPVKAAQMYFSIRSEGGPMLALVTTPDYFASGIDAFIKFTGTVLDQASIPVRSLVRVYAAKNSFNEWIAVPLVIVESG